ncbi:MAG TPA: 16S rRNA (adenine(1518)-N(6)/adenine(1519)-N(6))-dimethyltransferase RsmA [Roseiflexaceae bacterium]|nr:16S rRNA (adenine(1518)-N(6)/adenine(1519)-N(6))-dimethyltransferase RsmA [Roseiflexaceae bacterium]
MENPYLSPARVRAALRALELRPTRGMGQNFLIDPDALGAIVGAAGLSRADTVIEVGPGLGVLTWELLARAGHVTVVELDRRLADRLGQEFPSQPNLRIVQGDILNLPSEQLTGVGGISDGFQPLTPSSQLPPYKVVANLPYAITSAVLRHFLEAEYKPELMVLLVQWEVAQRIVAGPGDLSVLAHSVQIYAEPEIIARLPSASFVPAPAIDSAVLRLRVRPEPAVAVEVAPLMRLIKAGFLQARKKLSNALPTGLAAMGVRVDKQRAVAALAAAGVDPNRRAETVTLEEWVRVYHELGVREEREGDEEG